ncbi:predicted protein [Naegleria gruberi]|uniref:Predicted protein n=1 Tax=Naegleria gruberi TaxID=5762 RepID=D2W4A5_NAEGR|nr:uncharacterized protein NAEGRDRAFT_76235 [Naegleria gruberi]EFC36094.1 predicted protein [Naegleria gruberi]|eukprot:XP_002668838.1 predicted protein [Naegleria gruberi strain NEG-M]
MKRKKQKSSLIRIPRKSVPLEDQQPSVIVETPILVEIERLNYDMKLLQRFYEQQRHGELCKSAREILNKKLHPDFCKFGHFLGLGSCLPDGKNFLVQFKHVFIISSTRANFSIGLALMPILPQ